MAIRKGNQEPTKSVLLNYKKSEGKEAIALYESTGNKLYPWQKKQLKNILATTGKKWKHSKFGIAISRRNGKNEVIAAREMYGLTKGEQIIHTAHRTSTSHMAWERLCDLLDSAEIPYRSNKQLGFESITLKENGARINFRTRSSKGGLGEGYDLEIIDEAQEYTYDQKSALKYLVSGRGNPQTIYIGTPPTPTSSGTVFTDMRKAALRGESQNTGWVEWSVDEMHDVYDREAWYLTNPRLGYGLTESDILDEIDGDNIDFNIQRLGLWLKYNQKSAISKVEWMALKEEIIPKLKGKLFVGIKYGKDGKNVAMSIAARTEEEKIFVETIDCREIRAGTDWIINFLEVADIAKVAIDGQNGQSILAADMKEHKLKLPVLPTVKEIITANATFEQGIYKEKLCHMGQPSLMQIVSNCEKRTIGTNGGFGYQSLVEGIEIALMDSALLAYWLCKKTKESKPQKVSY